MWLIYYYDDISADLPQIFIVLLYKITILLLVLSVLTIEFKINNY